MNDETCDVEASEIAVHGADPHEADWYGFDTENDENGVVTESALVSESGAETVWRKAGPFADWCERRMSDKKPAIVICHNLEYDLVNEFGPKRYADFGLNYLKGRLISAKMGCIKFQDSFNHFRMGLIDIGKAIGIQKKEMDIHSAEYVATDAWICLRAMTQARDYIASLGGKIGATSGSSAMSVWAYMTDKEFFTGPHDTLWMRKGYYGGRTEIFRRNSEGLPLGIGWDFKPDGEPFERLFRERGVKAYDINSMYPYCMLNEFPEYFMDDLGINKGKGMAEVTVSVPPDLFVAPLCHRSVNDQLLYPVGVFRGVWTYDEIRKAESMGVKVLEVHKAIGGNAMVRPFDQFILTLYAKRKASASEAERLFLKVLMNALYGKIASRNQVTRTVSRHQMLKTGSKRMDEVKWITYHRGLLDYFTPQQPYVNVLWGSMITAYARNLTMEYMLKVPQEKLVYCDTDSIWTLYHDFPTSSELGALKLEKAEESCFIPQPKAYRMGEFYRAKGVPRPRTDKKTGITIDYARQYVEEGFTEFQAPIRFRASLNSHKGVANQWVKHQKSRKTPYSAKRLSGEVYYPPCIGEQLEFRVAKRPTKRKAANLPTAQLGLGI
jgi:hypothetical protein